MSSLLYFLVFIQSQPEEPGVQKAEALVWQLADPSFLKREAASRELIALGSLAKQAVQKGGLSRDAEVRDRCRIIFPQILSLDIKQRLNRLEKLEGNVAQIDLPGWKRLTRLGGLDDKARAKYLAVLRQHIPEIILLESDPRAFVNHYESRLMSLHDFNGEAIRGFREAAYQVELNFATDELMFWLITLSDERAQKQTERQDDKRYGHLKLLLKQLTFMRHWIDKDRNTLTEALLVATLEEFVSDSADSGILFFGFDLLQKRPLSRMADLSASILKRHIKNSDLNLKALSTLGRFGHPDHLQVLEKFLLDSSTLASGYYPGYITQYRDFALAMALRIQKQRPQHFGFALDVNSPEPKAMSYGFKEEAQRQKAFEMYGDFLRK